MGNWQERLREIEEKEQQETVNMRAQAVLRQQQENLRLQKEKELRNVAERQEEKIRLKFDGILQNLHVRQKLEEVNHQVWQDQGFVVDLNRLVRLSFDYEITIPEIQNEEWDVVVERGSEHTEFFGWNTYIKTQRISRARVINEYKVIKPSYLEIGISNEGSGPLHRTLYMLDTEVELNYYEDKVFHELAKKAGETRIGDSKKIEYTDIDGNIFNKKPRLKHGSSLLDFFIGRGDHDFSYNLVNSHYATCISIALPSEPDIKAMGDFINYGLALSCSLRISQNKLPSQLK